MREIKFRAWDGEETKMVYGLTLENGDMGFFHHLDNDEDIDLDYRDVKPIIMQYTGLKDRLYKEIYEGDIIKQGGHPIADIKFKEGSFCTYIKPDRWIELSQNSFRDEFEVIGNIFESPELLTK